MFSLLIACLVLPIGSVVAQCPNVAVLDAYESPCGSGLNNGQSFTAAETGSLDTVIIARCTASDARLVLRAFNGTGSDWDEGSIIGEADAVLLGTDNPDGCFTSGGNGFTPYAAGTFTFTGVSVETGVQYTLHLLEGAAATGCNISYAGGNAFSAAGSKTGEDLAFSLSICPGTPVFGCMDPSACNYDAAATAEDGSCLSLDCAGQCGGSAYDDPDCGCVPSAADAGSCIGCTDATACNYLENSTVDDGSCFFPVCNGACPDILNFYETPCGTGLNYGQGFTATITGLLNSITIARCTGVDTRILIRNYNGDGAEWDQGNLIGEADQVVSGNQTPSDCFISGGNGFTNYVETTFTFTNIGLEAGQQYVFQLEQGVAATGCNISYSGGTAFGLNAAKPSEDLVFELSMCPDNVTFGCTDPSACNYDATVDVEDGSCLFLDCQGTCGGSAYLDPDCGCLDSIDDAGQCLGCTDPAACNYDITATASDGSCTLPDCHGDCGGTATTSSCGCIGGNTGIPASACVDGCITNVDATDSDACPPGILYGQTITPAENGLLKRIRLKTCCALDAQLVIRTLTNTDPCSPGGGGTWNSGTILGYSNTVPSSCSSVTSCLTGFGLDGYHWHNFDFGDVPVQAGTTYVLELVSGVAIANCTSDYAGGQAFNASEALPDYDLVFAMHICPASMNWGCTDATACTYDPTANQDDGSCQYLDCNGDCGGSALDVAGCGCIGGNTDIREAQCVNGDLHNITANDGTICNETLKGQSLVADAHGFLSRIGLHVMPDAAQTVQLSRTDGPNAGEVLLEFTRAAVSSSCGGVEPEWVELDFYNIPLQGGSQYQLDFLSGAGYRTCYPEFSAGAGINASGAATAHDLAFQVIYRTPEPGELVWGCSDASYCNYDPAVTHDDGSCTTLDCHGDCGGTAYEISGCGCVEGNTGVTADSCYGCTDPTGCNYDVNASIDDGSCAVVDCHGDCGGTAISNANCGCVGGNTGIDPGTCLDRCQGSLALGTYDGQFNSDGYAMGGSGQTFTATETSYLTAAHFRQANEPASFITVELRKLDAPDVHNGTLLSAESFETWTDTEGEGGDLFIEWDIPALLTQGEEYALVLIGSYTLVLEGEDDVYAGGASFDGLGSTANGPDLFFELFTCPELLGCIDPAACNFDAVSSADTEPTTCIFPEGCEICTGETDGTGTVSDFNNDVDDDGVCNADEILGCTDAEACNYDATPTTDSDNSLCLYPTGCETCTGETDGTGTVSPTDNDTDSDGVCNGDEVLGCSDNTACNYDATPTTDTDNTLCVYPNGCETCSGETDGSGTTIDNDDDGDGVCNDSEVLGCTDQTACNYDATFTTDTDNSLCTYPVGCEVCSGETDGSGTTVVLDDDNDGVCNGDELLGCTDVNACNYDATPTTDTDNSLCIYVSETCDTCSGETDGSGTVVDNDTDNDGVCASDEVLGCTDIAACNYDATPTTDTDNSLCVYPTGCQTCSEETDGTGTVLSNDADNDGVCDDDEVTGCTDSNACNYDATPTTDTDNSVCIFSTGCESCSGHLDGTGFIVENDDDGDGVCNAVEVTGCTNPEACNYDATPTTDTDNTLCIFKVDACDTCSGETDGSGTVIENDTDDDGVCDDDEITGCTDPLACNYDATTTTDTDNTLCIFQVDACDTCSGETDGSGTVVDNDADDDGVCDDDEIKGCTNPIACNYDATTTTDTDNALCIFKVDACDTCSGETDGSGTVVDNDDDDDGVCDDDEVIGCTNPLACNYDATPTTNTDNTLCAFKVDACDTCSGETDGSGTVVDNDADDDGVCNDDEVTGCTNSTACNYDATSTTDTDNSLCVFKVDACDTCSGETDGTGTVVDNDDDNDGVCDDDEVTGCTNSTACNYDATSTTDTDNTLCVFKVDACDTCSGETDGTGTVVDNDADDDGVCDDDEVTGCTNPTACNYDATSTTDTDNTLCVFKVDACDTCSGETDGTGTVVDNDADDDGVCNANEITGCTDPTACNYDATSTTDTDNTLCVFKVDACDTCSGETDGTGTVVDNDADNDGVCNDDEVTGCTNPTACNYDATSTTDTDNSLCAFKVDACDTCSGETDGTGTVVDNDDDNDGVCDDDEVTGCTNPAACNYDATSTTDTDNTLCLIPAGCDTCSGETDGTGSVVDNDEDNDGVCNDDEVTGCTNPLACNYDATSTTDTDNTLCVFKVDACDTCSGETDGTGTVTDNDADDDGVCDGDEITGCTDPTACNYDATSTTNTDNTLCVFKVDACDTCSGQTDGTGSVVDNDADDDGVCNANEITGCTNPTACNYDATSTTDTDNTQCIFKVDDCDTCSGETDGTGSVVDNDTDNDGVCDDDEVTGCTNPEACNYDATSTTDTDNALCVFKVDACDTCSGETDGTGSVIDNDSNNDGICDSDAVQGCMNITACNFDSSANTEDGTCEFTSCAGCINPAACNYNPAAVLAGPPGTCTFPSNFFVDCNGQCLSGFDTNNNGICDPAEIPGCMNVGAANFNADANIPDGSCLFETVGCIQPDACNYNPNANIADVTGTCVFPAEVYLDCNGQCVNDINGNGICDEIEIQGCTDDSADNYNAAATSDDGTCFTSTAPGCIIPSAINFDPAATVQGLPVSAYCNFNFPSPPSIMPTPDDCADSYACNYNPNAGGYSECEYASCLGCDVAAACNYDATATYNDGSCEYSSCTGCTNNGACNFDASATIDNGSCEYDSCAGCTEPHADNYDATASLDDGSCEYFGCTNYTACNYGCTDAAGCSSAGVAGPNTDDGSCEFSSCAGCMNAGACNYDAAATIASTCEYSSCSGCTDNSADNYDATATIDNGSCEYHGCTNYTACNYDATATADDGSCTYPATGLDCQGQCADIDNNNICDSTETPVPGCTISSACNYDPAANQNNGSCLIASAAALDIAVQLDANGAATISAADVDAGSSGGCTIASSTVNPNTFDSGDIGTVTALFSVTDDQGNTSSDAFTVSVQDLISPVASANDITLEMPNTAQEVVLSALDVSTSTDNAGIASQTLSQSTFVGCDDVTTHTVTLTVTDYAGNVDQVDFTVTITHPDVDNDGICDDQDNCTDLTASNFDDPANGVCQPCGLAPVFLGFSSVTPASTLDASDGVVQLNLTSGSAITLELTGLNGTADLSVAIPNELGTIPAGFYSARVRDAQGCFGVATAPGGTTFGQPAVSRTLMVPYALCCNGCGQYDSDTDGICDGSDNCTDRTAPNFNDPANGPCE